MVEVIFNAMVANMVENGWKVFWKRYDSTVNGTSIKYTATAIFTKNDVRKEFSTVVYNKSQMKKEIEKFMTKVG